MTVRVMVVREQASSVRYMVIGGWVEVKHTLLNGNRDTGSSLVLDAMVSVAVSGDGNSEAEDNGEELHF